MPEEPLIILGMHRSGTTMLTKYLSETGSFFFGADLEHNHESLTFIKMNDWILRNCGASWDFPEPYDHTTDDYKELVKQHLDGYLRRVGWKHFYKKHLGASLRRRHHMDSGFWGWKDPRTSLTVDVWLEIFPRARFIHVHRHPLDVALSLQSRAQKFCRSVSFTQHLKEQHLIGINKYHESMRVLDLAEGVRLWKHYINSIAKQNLDIWHVSYESLVNAPEQELRKLSVFLDKDVHSNCDSFNFDRRRVLAYKNAAIPAKALALVNDDSAINELGYHV